MLAASALGACTEPTPGPRNVVLVALDTLRADRLGAYGYERPTSPSIDGFAARGTVFENAVAASSWTIPSFVTMLSGISPSGHGVTLPRHKPAPDLPMLAEVLQAAGFATLGLTGGGYLGKRYDFDRGFDRYLTGDERLDDRIRTATSELDARGFEDPFFLFVHTYDIHCPYAPRPPYDRMFESPGAEPIDTRHRCGNPDYNRMDLSLGQVRHISDQYDGGVREADEALSRLFRWLGDRGLWESTLVILTSDHGEELYDHGRIGHERTLHREALHIPLVLAGPGVPIGRVAAPVGHVDVMPTILDLVGIPAPGRVEGRSLARHLGGGGEVDAGPVFSEIDHLARITAVLQGGFHLILDHAAPARPRLYDWAGDPEQRHDLAKERPEVVAELRQQALAHREALRHFQPARPGPEPPAEMRRLRALGYAE